VIPSLDIKKLIKIKKYYRNAEFACGYGAKLIFGSEGGGLDNQGSWSFCESSTSFEMSFHGSCGEGGENFWWQ
jgi:hypothetical protein